MIVGNPPFLSGKLLIGGLCEDYVARMFAAWKGHVPQEADLVCYWFVKAGEQIASDKATRVGLVATNSIRGGANRQALQAATQERPIFEAWSDEPWVIDGAAVRVSLVCFSDTDDAYRPEMRLDGEPVDEIHADLTARRGETGIDLTRVRRLSANMGVAFMGDTKGGPFDVPGDLAREWLRLPTNPNGRPNADVLKPWLNGMDITRRPAGKWIVDFGWEMNEEEAALYEAPFEHVRDHVHPMRQKNRRKAYRDNWWRHVEPRQGMWRALDGLSRFIVTPTVAKHRLFVWLDGRVCPDHQLIAIARDDDVTFGILHSRFHEAWSLRLDTSLEDRPRYTPTTTFETFPFPDGLSPVRRQLCRRPARRRHCRGRAAIGRAARPLAQPARMGELGRRADAGLSEAPGPGLLERNHRVLRLAAAPRAGRLGPDRAYISVRERPEPLDHVFLVGQAGAEKMNQERIRRVAGHRHRYRHVSRLHPAGDDEWRPRSALRSAHLCPAHGCSPLAAARGEPAVTAPIIARGSALPRPNGLQRHQRGDGLPHPLGGGFDLAVSEVGVSEGHSDIGMAEQPRDHRHGHAVHHGVAGMRMAEIVKPDILDAGVLPDAAPEPELGAARPGRIARGREHERAPAAGLPVDHVPRPAIERHLPRPGLGLGE